MADVAVRPAEPTDVPELARIQRDTWRIAYARLLPDAVLAALDVEEAEQAWRYTVDHGPATVWVAVEGAHLVGFCAAGPAPDAEVADAAGSLPPDAATVVLVSALLVEPRWGRRGHGGRLLATAAADLRARGFSRGITWVPEADQASRRFYGAAGWTPDGIVRVLDAAGQPLRELRLGGSLDLRMR